ncbi:hypothetical protein BT96DRAFT_933490 [Gymnopus androsaceus JB14]|uniref:CCHC-type domain-containing protein n=1 Tax=Gymnopus androsaceus JB14 TaxID=1447944 RepID=A0A6A4I8V8_9AGAR|nr:hypothetical protein BT96DRAFT_933490 [Gymnopus androsaceus JB14]
MSQPSTDTTDLVQRAIKERLMNENDNYFTTFPAQMLRLAAEQMVTPVPTLMARKKAWEQIEIMAKLLRGQVWRSREDGLREELVKAVMEKVEERIGGVQEWASESTKVLKEAVAELGRVAKKVDAAPGKAGMQAPPGDAPEEGEIPSYPMSYAHAVQTGNITSQIQQPKHNAVIQAGRMIDRKFVIRSETEDDWTLSEAVLLAKANHALELVLAEEGEEKDVKRVVAVQKIREMGWSGGRLDKFTNGWGSTAKAKPNYYRVLVELVPVEASLEIGSDGLGKKPEKRKQDQKVAHILVAFNTREAANQVIAKGMTVAGKWVYGQRDQRDPLQCMKCQQFGHIAKECNSERDICGRCDGEHPMQTCTAHHDGFYCAVCKLAGHAATDRNCPSLLNRLQETSQRNPDRNYRFYVTEHPETWIREEEAPEPRPDEGWRLELRKGYDENWRTVQRGNGRGRLAGGMADQGGGSQKSIPVGQGGQGARMKTTPIAPRQQGPIHRYFSQSQTRSGPAGEPSSTQQDWGGRMNDVFDASDATQPSR